MSHFDIKEVSFCVEYDPQGRFWNSKWNLHKDVLTQYTLPESVSITDSTIREGEEAPNVVYRMEDKIRIARLLDAMKVHEIDCGFASFNQSHLEFLKELSREKLRIKKSAIVRIDLPDFNKGIERVAEAKADIVLCALYPTPIPGYGRLDYLRRVKDAIVHCKTIGVFSSFWVTCTRWEEAFVLEIYKAAVDAGVDRIKTAGGGVLTVPAYKRMVKLLKGVAGKREVGIHAHNNYGLATACTLAGIEAGASNVETSVNGLADGAGLAAFEEVVLSLLVMYGIDTGIKIDRIMELSLLVQHITGIKVHPYKPIVGESVFLETPDTHIEGILRARLQGKMAKNYLEPEAIGQKASVLFGPSALGGEAIRLKGQEMGVTLSEEQLRAIMTMMRNRLNTVDSLSEEEVENIILRLSV
jgi:isopropylmalate/homocitrate/citramalate synthase